MNESNKMLRYLLSEKHPYVSMDPYYVSPPFCFPATTAGAPGSDPSPPSSRGLGGDLVGVSSNLTFTTDKLQNS